MALTYGFFNSVNGDRVYSAVQMSEMFDGLICDGVYNNVADGLRVVESSGLTVNVSAGRARINSQWAKVDAPYPIILNPAHVTLNRYTAICLRVDFNNREIQIIARDGTNATSPSKPGVIRNSQYYDMILAYIYLPNGTSNITQANIEDTRANTSVCGFVMSLVQQLNTQQLYSQYVTAYSQQLEKMNAWFTAQQNAYNTWFSDLIENLNVDTHITSKTDCYTPPIRTSDLSIPSTVNYNYGDILQVYMDGAFLTEGVDYELKLNTSSKKYYLWLYPSTFENMMDKRFTFTVIKSQIGVPSTFMLGGNISVSGTTLTIDDR